MTTPSKHGLRLALACSLLCSGAGSLAAEEKQTWQPSPPAAAVQGTAAEVIQLVPMQSVFSTEASSSGENRFFVNGAQHFADMKRRLEDPVEREKFRAEQRAQLAQQHTEIADVLGLDAQTTEKLLDLLAAQQFETMEQFYERAGGGTQYIHSLEATLQRQADAETRRLDALSALIGEERLDRYQTYAATLSSRSMISQLDAKLPTADKLQREQKERLILLADEQFQWQMSHRAQSRMFGRGMMQSLLTREDMQRQAQLSTIESNEDMWRSGKEASVRFERRAAQFLKPAQLAAFKQMNADRSNTLRDWILRARAEAGLSAEIPDKPAERPAEDPARMPVASDIEFEMTLRVNGGEPVTVSQIAANGEKLAFDLSDGLSIEVTPTLFTDRWFDVQTSFLEQRRDGKRRIGNGGSSGTSNQYRTDDVNQATLSTVVNGGRRGYAITGTATVKQLQL